jgi:hypothetical protein
MFIAVRPPDHIALRTERHVSSLWDAINMLLLRSKALSTNDTFYLR